MTMKNYKKSQHILVGTYYRFLLISNETNFEYTLYFTWLFIFLIQNRIIAVSKLNV